LAEQIAARVSAKRQFTKHHNSTGLVPFDRSQSRLSIGYGIAHLRRMTSSGYAYKAPVVHSVLLKRVVLVGW
jgi:hypothetical protein